MDKNHQMILLATVFTQTPTLVELTQVVRLIMHAISASRPRDEILRAQLSIIASIFQQSKSILPVASLDSLKELVFVRPGVLKDIMMSMSSKGILQGELTFFVGPPFPFSQTISGVQSLTEAILSPTLENDRKLVSDISYYWVTVVKGGLDDKNEYSVSSELFLVFLLTNDVFFRSHLPVCGSST